MTIRRYEDFHEAYHVHGMKDPYCLACEWEYVDERRNVEVNAASGCADCGLAYSLYFNCQFHQSDCPSAPMIAGPSAKATAIVDALDMAQKINPPKYGRANW